MKTRCLVQVFISEHLDKNNTVKRLILKVKGRRPFKQIRNLIIYNFNKGKSMAKRQSWTPQEDKIIGQLIHTFQASNKKIKWAQISQSLKMENPQWSRTGKQCRERWLNHLKPSFSKRDQIDHIDLQQLFRLIRVHGKKWSLIAKELPGRTDNSIKNFFYAALRKGLRNLNLYNADIRSQRRYKVFKQDLIDKLLSVHDERKNQDLYISDGCVYDLADEIRENLIKSSFDELKPSSVISDLLEKFYEDLNDSVMNFCRICKFKKSRGKKCDQEGQKFEIFTRKLKKYQVKVQENSQQSHMLKSQTTQERDVKIEEELQIYEENQNLEAKILPLAIQMEEEGSNVAVEPQLEIYEKLEFLELPLTYQKLNENQKSLFEMLSMPQMEAQALNLLY